MTFPALHRGGVVAAVAVATLLAIAPAAHADAPPQVDKATRAEAEGHFNKGVAAYTAKDLPTALTEFSKAYELAPNFRVLYNIAKIQVDQKDYVTAARTYDKYLADGGSQVSVPRKAEVTDELRKIASHVAQVTIRATTDGVDVTVDDVALGKTPLASGVPMNAGSHKIAGTKGGRTPVEQKIDVVGGVAQTVTLDLALVPVAAGDPPPNTVTPVDKPTVPPEKKGSRTLMIAGWSTTGVFAVATAVTGILAAGASNRYDDKLATFGVTHADLKDSQGSARTLVIVTGVLGGLTVASAAVSVYFTLGKPKLKERASAFDLVIGPGSVGARGVF